MRRLAMVLVMAAVLGAGCQSNLRDPTDPAVQELAIAAGYSGGFAMALGGLQHQKATPEQARKFAEVAENLRALLTPESTAEEVQRALDGLIDEVPDETARNLCRAILPAVVMVARNDALAVLPDEDVKAWAELGVRATAAGLRGARTAALFYAGKMEAETALGERA